MNTKLILSKTDLHYHLKLLTLKTDLLSSLVFKHTTTNPSDSAGCSGTDSEKLVKCISKYMYMYMTTLACSEAFSLQGMNLFTYSSFS